MDSCETVNTITNHCKHRVEGSILTGGEPFAECMNDSARILAGFGRKGQL